MFRAGFGTVANFIIGSLGAIFLTIIGLGVMDYHRQAVVAGVAPSEFGLAGWTQSFVERGKDAARRAQIETRRDGPMNSYFPGDTGGWQRFEWNEGFDILLAGPDREMPDWEKDFRAELESNTHFKALKAVDHAAGSLRNRGKGRNIAVYLKGEKAIILRARMKAGKSGFMAALEANIAGSALTDKKRLVKAYSGVAFEQISRSRNKSGGYTTRLKALIGDELEISVKTNTSLSDIDSVLRHIRYKDLKALVGAEADNSGTRQRDLTAELRRQEMERKRKAAETRRRIDERLEREKRFARGRDIAEVCITEGGKSYCAWVD
ncbi:hypothetical protein [Pacificoceanicola onchidii]|uniref:hypothetical protein n=1 Tax=Pacificoceanicola onchidii TaxID=2562685 RepID=UPI0010A64C02|nr:hypothetical protein [Pacificoceanicola onchidii]